jgi:hypothetical protein
MNVCRPLVNREEGIHSLIRAGGLVSRRHFELAFDEHSTSRPPSPHPTFAGSTDTTLPGSLVAVRPTGDNEVEDAHVWAKAKMTARSVRSVRCGDRRRQRERHDEQTGKTEKRRGRGAGRSGYRVRILS